MRLFPGSLLLVAALAAVGQNQTPMDIEQAQRDQQLNFLGTCRYAPSAKETPFFSGLPEKERVNDPVFHGSYTIHGKAGGSIAWFGIVRGITPHGGPKDDVTLLVEHHFFDGATDCHIMLVSKTGDGDFTAKLNVDPVAIPALSLVRVYGRITGEVNHRPEVQVDYIRVWPWLAFTFADFGAKDHSNPRWLKYSQMKPDENIYAPYPDRDYYLRVLGDPADFGLTLKQQ